LLIAAAFQHSVELEQALTALEKLDIEQNSILAIPMEKYPPDNAGQLVRKQDRKANAFEMGMAVATAFAVVGMSRGFILEWGPIIWGIISGAAGFGLGYLLCYLFAFLRGEKTVKQRKPMPEVTVLVRCKNEMKEQIEGLFWAHKALTVGIYNPSAASVGTIAPGAAQHAREA
jgi:hypothetical protein